MTEHAGLRRRTVLKTAAAVTVLSGPALPARTLAADVVKIGLPVALTGPIGGIGEQMKRACEFWGKQVNAKGGLLGKKIEFVTQDTTGNPANAVRSVQEMVERDGIRLITCVVASNEALAIVPKLAGWDTIFISGDNGDGRLTAESLVPNFFRPNTSGPMGTRAVALWLRESKLTKFYGLGMDYAWGHNSMDVFQNEVKKAGRQFLGAVFSPTGTKDFSTYITKIRQSGADACYLVLAGDDNNAFLSQAKQYRLSDKVQLLTELVDEMSLKAVGEAAVGMVGGSRYTPTYDSPENKAFIAAWQAEYNRLPMMFEGDQYQSCVVLQAGVEKANSFDTAKIRSALEGLKLTSVKGPLEMRACDHQAAEQGFVVKVVEKPGTKDLVPQVIATYPADKITPPCNKMEYTD
ncbi:MAG TPA: ABC transporter substrate-binding protein [Rhodopila sp.]|uniref:ABC transporter substrate-binding protein n=1 Tax=Rhodopila sp. TaxID=2480087 RepID=UPI002B93485A|nr:ABC transporter substrate-binding protein [Rhodopila sp.]HVY16529.1 ABC transporter substrate-binding protein [Rhodopila sp.]